MMRLHFGDIGSTDGKRYKDIICESTLGVKIKDLLIGGGLIAAGVIYISKMAFKNGANSYYFAENKALSDLGLIDIDIDKLSEIKWTFGNNNNHKHYYKYPL